MRGPPARIAGGTTATPGSRRPPRLQSANGSKDLRRRDRQVRLGSSARRRYTA